MKTKYVMNGGLAFSEKRDTKKLEKMAAKGWLFKSFAFGGFLYKLEQGQPQELCYTMDFQSKPDFGYFEIFSSAGWQHITSASGQIHVFSAPKGTAPIYSGNEIEEGKYLDITSGLGKGAVLSLLALIVFWFLMVTSKTYFSVMFYPLAILTGLSTISFVFCFMPYVAYKYKEKTNH